MKVIVTKHCIDQIIKRKEKKTEKQALFFAIWIFPKMVKNTFWNLECKIRKWKDWTFIVSNKETWYKFVYSHDKENDCFTLITFAIHSKLDFEVWKLIKRLTKLKNESYKKDIY